MLYDLPFTGRDQPQLEPQGVNVQELIRVLNLPDTFTDNLHPYVREKFTELAAGVRDSPDDEKEPA